MLQTLIDVTRANPSVLVISAVGTVVGACFGTWFSFTIVSIYVKYDPDNRNPGCMTTGGSCSNGKLIGLILFAIFCGYYLTEVIKNVIHVTISGVYGSWYYCSKSDQGMPKHAAMSSFRRAVTYSLGSISLGSLIVSIINFIRQILSVLQQDARQSGDTLATVLLCFVQCCFGVLDWLVTYFNHYAYSYIALYGKAYVPSAKATWKLMQTRGIDAMVNDSLIGSVLSFGASFVAYAAALVAYCFLKYTDPSYNSGGGFYAPVVGLAFVIALQVSNITNVSLKSGCSTFSSLWHVIPRFCESVIPRFTRRFAEPILLPATSSTFEPDRAVWLEHFDPLVHYGKSDATRILIIVSSPVTKSVPKTFLTF